MPNSSPLRLEHMIEHQKRRHRLRALKGGSILFYNGAAFDCTVRNLSETGARLEVENPVGIPDTFKLTIKSKKLERACRVIWRKAKEIGVRFVGSASTGASLHPALNAWSDGIIPPTNV